MVNCCLIYKNNLYMKNLLLSVFILFSINIYSQDTIFLKNGTKIIPRGGVSKYNGRPLTEVGSDYISYALPNSSWSKSVKFKDLDYVVIGDKMLKTFELKYKDKPKRTKPLGHFVLIETGKYRLISITYSGSLIVPLVKNFVIDNDNTLVESANYIDGTTKNDAIKKQKVVELIKKYFSNIKEEMEFLDECILRNKSDDYSGISDYLNTHSYKKYN